MKNWRLPELYQALRGLIPCSLTGDFARVLLPKRYVLTLTPRGSLRFGVLGDPAPIHVWFPGAHPDIKALLTALYHHAPELKDETT